MWWKSIKDNIDDKGGANKDTQPFHIENHMWSSRICLDSPVNSLRLEKVNEEVISYLL